MDTINLKSSLEDNVNSLSDRVWPKVEEAKRRLRSLNGQTMALIKEHPAACLLGAAALGYLVARLARRQRS